MNSIITHFCHLKNSPIGHDLPTSVNAIVITPICKGFIFTKFTAVKFRENKTLAKNSGITVMFELLPC